MGKYLNCECPKVVLVPQGRIISWWEDWGPKQKNLPFSSSLHKQLFFFFMSSALVYLYLIVEQGNLCVQPFFRLGGVQEETINWDFFAAYLSEHKQLWREPVSGRQVLLSAGSDPEMTEKLHGHRGRASREVCWVDTYRVKAVVSSPGQSVLGPIGAGYPEPPG